MMANVMVFASTHVSSACLLACSNIAKKGRLGSVNLWEVHLSMTVFGMHAVGLRDQNWLLLCFAEGAQ